VCIAVWYDHTLANSDQLGVAICDGVEDADTIHDGVRDANAICDCVRDADGLADAVTFIV